MLWRLNTSILNDRTCKEHVQKEFKDYMDNNNNGEVSPSVLWDAAKAVIRGKCIALTSHRKKERYKKLSDLEENLKVLEREHIESKEPCILNQIRNVRKEINKLCEEELEKKAKFAKQRYYENGPRALKLLGWRLRKQQADSSIYEIRDPGTKQLCHKLEDIEHIFENYYRDLYKEPNTTSPQQINSFLESLDLPSIGEEQNKALMAEITMEEIGKAISRLKANKAPGTDGFPGEWYKAFKDEIVPMLFDCFNYTLKKGEPPSTWREAIILVIPKEGKDRKECSSYRPISVLNIDYKLYASILVKRLEHIIVELVDPDQTGFVRERQTQDNIRRVLHVIDHVNKGNIGATVISLDAEKAFDSVRWKYLYLALRRFGFKDDFINCIRTLYSSPNARIKINGHLSQVVNLERGCRQGCPLSPALFALFIEPLAQLIRDDEVIKGVMVRGLEQKICLYADDVLLFITTPEVSIPRLMSSLKDFGAYSGYKLNVQKTQTLSYNYSPQKDMLNRFNFKWTSSDIKYLGIKIPKDISKIYDSNYGPISKNIKADIDRWSQLPLDMHNRIETIKMNVLPRLFFNPYQL